MWGEDVSFCLNRTSGASDVVNTDATVFAGDMGVFWLVWLVTRVGEAIGETFLNSTRTIEDILSNASSYGFPSSYYYNLLMLHGIRKQKVHAIVSGTAPVFANRATSLYSPQRLGDQFIEWSFVDAAAPAVCAGECVAGTIFNGLLLMFDPSDSPTESTPGRPVFSFDGNSIGDESTLGALAVRRSDVSSMLLQITMRAAYCEFANATQNFTACGAAYGAWLSDEMNQTLTEYAMVTDLLGTIDLTRSVTTVDNWMHLANSSTWRMAEYEYCAGGDWLGSTRICSGMFVHGGDGFEQTGYTVNVSMATLGGALSEELDFQLSYLSDGDVVRFAGSAAIGGSICPPLDDGVVAQNLSVYDFSLYKNARYTHSVNTLAWASGPFCEFGGYPMSVAASCDGVVSEPPPSSPAPSHPPSLPAVPLSPIVTSPPPWWESVPPPSPPAVIEASTLLWILVGMPVLFGICAKALFVASRRLGDRTVRVPMGRRVAAVDPRSATPLIARKSAPPPSTPSVALYGRR